MRRRLNRRSFMGCVIGGSVAAGGALARIGEARAQVTDRDSGPNADPAGRGRGRSGVTDRDSGPNADPAGRGRGGASGVTDRDSGPNADPAGRGRGRAGGSGVTDRDSGPNADPAGRGRGSGSGGGGQSRPCNYILHGDYEFVQSNNITGTLALRQSGSRITGTATFYSPTMRQQVEGRVEGFMEGTNFQLRIAWYARGVEYDSNDRWDFHTYDETGIYDGRISPTGSIEGTNRPFNRPQAQTNWFARQRAFCR